MTLFLGSSQAEEEEEAGPEMKMRRREEGQDHLVRAHCLTSWNLRWEFSPSMVSEPVQVSSFTTSVFHDFENMGDVVTRFRPVVNSPLTYGIMIGFRQMVIWLS